MRDRSARGVLGQDRPTLAERGGNRQANNALYRIVITLISAHPPIKDYVARRRAEGKSTGEIVPVLRRDFARELYKHLPRAALTS